MVLKRHFTEGQGSGSESPDRESRRRLAFTTVVREVMNGRSLQEFTSNLEPFIRRVVRDEVEQAIQRFWHSSPRSSVAQIESSGAWSYQLNFQCKFPSTLFSGSRIESEDGEPVKIVIVDANSKKEITSGPFSSIKIEIVVLHSDFGADDRENWTEKDFNDKVVHEREGKRPLVTGDLVITLRDGVGYIGDLCFTDNSSWVRTRKFRLGARVQSISPEVRIREARSEAFIVKDHRGESYKKHHPPSLGDEIWRLERISKDGAFHKRLAHNRIFSVKDFLQLYVSDPSSLRNILGGGISNKTWVTIIEHATACVLDDKLYMYYPSAENVGLVFNSIFRVVGATFDGQNYQCLDKLDAFQMRLVEDLKQRAYKNLHDLVPIDEPLVVDSSMLLSSLQAEPFSNPSLGLQDVNIPLEHQDQLQMQLGSNHMTTSMPYTYEVKDGNRLEVPVTQNSRSMRPFSPTLRNSFMMRDFRYGPYNGGYGSAPSGSLGSAVVTENVAGDDNSQFETSMWQRNGLFLSPNNQAVDFVPSDFGIHFSRKRNPKARWGKIRAAMKWVISVRRYVAAKRMARFFI